MLLLIGEDENILENLVDRNLVLLLIYRISSNWRPLSNWRPPKSSSRKIDGPGRQLEEIHYLLLKIHSVLLHSSFITYYSYIIYYGWGYTFSREIPRKQSTSFNSLMTQP
jgi:hypothetical protein